MSLKRAVTVFVLVVVSLGAGADLFGGGFLSGRDRPFSFVYGGEKVEGRLAGWVMERGEGAAVWRDPKTLLEVRCEAVVHKDFDAVEWAVRFTNTGDSETPVLEDIRVGDFVWDAGRGDCTLYYSQGSRAEITDFQPMEKALEVGAEPSVFVPFGGRPSDGYLPFFNVADKNGGIVVGIGWTGQWSASFQRTKQGVRVLAGMEKARFKLQPRETVRMPSVLVMRWKGEDRMAGQNKFRRLLLDHYMPRLDGALTAASPHAVIGFEKTTEANMLEVIRNIHEHSLPADYFWIDAGWYVSPQDNWARGVGNFTPDPARFPQGLGPVASAAHAAGMKFLLWFEPERVMPGTYLYEQHPDWLIAPPEKFPDALQYQYNDQFHLLDLAKPGALSWLEETVSKMISDVGIDAYRNDFNMYPSFYWRKDEPAEREGIEEIRYVTALYDYFDALRKQHPGLLLDTCASGGRRIDLEMIKRALVLTRSDYLWDPTGQQCHTYGLAQWLPITGIGAADTSPYNCRSGYGSHFTLAADYFSKDPAVWDGARKALQECKQFGPLFRKDFYPLSPYSVKNDVWMAWQYHDAEAGTGLVQAFRRQECGEGAYQCTLRGLEPKGVYVVKNYDSGATFKASGKELMGEGFKIELEQKPAAVIFVYSKES